MTTICQSYIDVFLNQELNKIWGAWVAQSVKRPTLDFGSGHGLTVVRLSPVLGSVLGMKPA